MSQVSNNLLGLALDDGAAFFVKESAQSESGVATISHVLFETYKFIGSEARTEYLMPQMTQMNWALRAFENNIPDCELLFAEAMETPSPLQAISKFDELIQMAAGSASAPCLRVIPGYAIMQNAYKSAESIQDGLHGSYSFDGYVRQKGPVAILAEPITKIDLDNIATQMNNNWVPMFTSLDLEVISRLLKISSVWIEGGLATLEGQMNDQDAQSVLRGLSIYRAVPDWAQVNLEIDEATGCIMIDGQVYENADAYRDAFPRGAAGNMPYHGAVRHIAAWTANHNRAMRRLPRRQDWDPNARVVGFDMIGGEHVIRHADGHTTIHDPVNHPYHDADWYVFQMNWNGVTEYAVFPRATTNFQTARAQAWRIFMQYHRGMPNIDGSGVRIAQRILDNRDAMMRRQAVVPGVAETLAQLRDRLTGSTYWEVQRIVDALLGVENCQTADQVNAYVLAVAEILQRIKAHYPQVTYVGDSPANAMMTAGYTVIGSGRYAPTEDSIVALVPILGRGVAPVEYRPKNAAAGLTGRHLEASRALNVSVVLEEPPSTVYSPVKTMLATALMMRFVGYVNGINTPPGYNFDVYDPANPFGVGQARPCPRVLMNRQLDRYEQALVHVIDNATVDGMPDLLRAVQKLTDAKYFLNNLDEVVDCIINREDWIYMLQSLIVSLLIHDGAQVTDSAGRNIVSVDAGVVPRQAAQFLFGTVLRQVRARAAYVEAVDAALSYGVQAAPAIADAANLARIIRGEVLFARAVNGLELLKSLLDGSNALVSNIHVGTVQHLIDVDLANELVAALTTVFNRDYLGLTNRVEYEAPWDCAEWTTQFGAFAFSVRSQPIPYQAVDVARECAVDSGLSAVTSALSRVGFEWSEIAPADLRVRGVDQSTYALTAPTPMAGQHSTGSDGFYNDAPIAHQALKVTVVVPSYDIEAYNLVKAYLTMNTSRTYFAQPVGTDIADQYSIRLPLNVKDELLDMILVDGYNGGRRDMLAADGMIMEKTPALANTAIIMPYVANYLQKTAITRDKAVPQIISVDTGKSIAKTSGVTILPNVYHTALLSDKNGLAITVAEKRSISTALPWVGS